MYSEWINIFLAFIEGFALIISPCILPILPIVLSGSLTGSRSRPLGIIVGFVITFCIVTLFSKALIDFAHIDPDILRDVSFAILFLLGVMMMSTFLTEKFKLHRVRFYSTISDAFCQSHYPKGWDPEVSESGYPITMTFIFGVSVKF